MKKTKAAMLLQGKQAIENKKLVENANLHEMDVMPVLKMIGALRFLQDLCSEKEKTIQDITPELIIDTIKNQPRFSFE